MKIILIGFMGAGKSTVAPLLAKQLNIPHYDTDEVLLRYTALPTIQLIISNCGETHFRELEHQAAMEVGSYESGVIATGGGLPMREENLLAIGGIKVFLDASFETLMGRIEDRAGRPILKSPEYAKALYEKRQEIYINCADIIVVTDGMTAEQVVSEVLQYIRLREIL